MYRRKTLVSFKWLTKINWGAWLFFSLVAVTVSVVVVFAWYGRNLPDPGKVKRESGFSTQILDRTGKEVLYDVFEDKDRKFVSIADVPKFLKDATVAIEDKDFYKHRGFDPMAALRIAKNLVTRGRLIGGSTLTQQLVKNVLLTQERSLPRKIKEFMLSLRIEKNYSKEEILQMYFNETPYGGTAWGVAAASQQYFGKEVKDLTLTESVILAGLPQAPSRYSPYVSGNSKAFIPRATDVARRMREDGYITKEQETQVLSELNKVAFKGKGTKISAPHFVMFVKQKLEEMYGPSVLESGGLKVITSLDWDLQQKAEAIVKSEVDKVTGSLNIKNGSSVNMDTNTGEILSMVGSKSYFEATIDGEVNVALRLRQPGSSIKPLVYATALLKGFTPASVLADVVTEFPGKDENTPYIPKNYDGKEHGLLHLREALGSSINIPAVKLLALVGVDDVLRQGFKMGIPSLDPTQATLSRVGLSMALGGAEVRLIDLVSAYSSFANGGYKVTPVAILKVLDSKGKVVYENKLVKPEKVIDEKVAFLMNMILSDNNARTLTFSANSLLNLGSRPVAVKTGTTNDLRDNWTVGWTRDSIVGVWVGNNDNEKMKNVASGVSGAGPIWRKQILNLLAKRPDKPFDVPSGVSQVEVDKVSGYPNHDGFASYKEWIIDGTLPSGPDPIHTKLKICKSDTNRLADQVNIQRGNFDEKEFVVIKESDPLTAKGLWQKGIDDWIIKQTDSIYKPPTEVCNPESEIDIKIISPDNQSRVEGDEVTIRFEVASGKPITRVELFVDDNLEQVMGEPPFVKKIKLTQGQHKVKVVARNSDGREAQNEHSFGLGQDWISPTPSPTPTPSISPTP